MTREFVRSRLGEAVRHLASSPDSIQRRVAHAYRSILIRLQPSDFPEDIRGKFEDVEKQLTSAEPKEMEDVAETSAAAMDDKAAGELAKAVVDIYERLLFVPDEDEP